MRPCPYGTKMPNFAQHLRFRVLQHSVWPACLSVWNASMSEIGHKFVAPHEILCIFSATSTMRPLIERAFSGWHSGRGTIQYFTAVR